MRRFSTLWVSALLLCGGCSVKEYTASTPKLVTLKTAQLRFSDMGYLRQNGDALQLELFSAAQAVERFEIDRLVCVSKGCMSKGAFNAEYLHASYPETLLQNVLLGRPIFDGKGFQKTASGFEQHIEGDFYTIVYRVDTDTIIFKDRKNMILIRLKMVK